MHLISGAFVKLRQVTTVIPRLTSDPANEFFGKRRFFRCFFGLG